MSTQTLTRTVTVTIDHWKTPCLPLEQNLGTSMRAGASIDIWTTLNLSWIGFLWTGAYLR
ncbi:MAG: hypothetical protein ABSB28_09640 [Candidatus Bathyarchaeia archaeon]